MTCAAEKTPEEEFARVLEEVRFRSRSNSILQTVRKHAAALRAEEAHFLRHFQDEIYFQKTFKEWKHILEK